MHFYAREPLKVTTAVAHQKQALIQKQMTLAGSDRDNSNKKLQILIYLFCLNFAGEMTT
jgi:hypothetical protein